MDEQRELLSAVFGIARPGPGELTCDEAGHPAGHSCLTPPEEYDLPTLQEVLRGGLGQPRNLASGGFVDPTVSPRTGLPLLAPFGDRLVEMRAWAYGGRWIGCGTARFGEEVRPVLLVAEREDPAAELHEDGSRVDAAVAEREDPAAELPEGTSWVDAVVAVTGWDARRRRTFDWADVEARLGTALPGDYKQLVELFGVGAFDGFLTLYLPDARFPGEDIVRAAERGRAYGELWEPYEAYPAPGGLLEWASSEQADQCFWLTEGPDPDRWPVMVTEDVPDSWQRFDGTTAEFVYRMLTDRSHPLATARYFDTHWFQSYESEGPE
ncbi:SMI1/KNR4 family protein [Streptomyces sp. NPDC091371]|uniref:SMI1/KNR4 family protein n=1 Tax=Streptomyces sp. NPDC091371 TaxID=3155303 RepID=UPI0034222EEA